MRFSIDCGDVDGGTDDIVQSPSLSLNKRQNKKKRWRRYSRRFFSLSFGVDFVKHTRAHTHTVAVAFHCYYSGQSCHSQETIFSAFRLFVVWRFIEFTFSFSLRFFFFTFEQANSLYLQSQTGFFGGTISTTKKTETCFGRWQHPSHALEPLHIQVSFFTFGFFFLDSRTTHFSHFIWLFWTTTRFHQYRPL